MDGLAIVGARSCDHACFLGPDPHAEDKRDLAAIAASQSKTTEAMKILDAQLGKTLMSPAVNSPWATFRSA